VYLGVEGLDTRALTRHIRNGGAMRAIISTSDLDPESLTRRARAIASMVGMDLARNVSTRAGHTAGTMAGPNRWPKIQNWMPVSGGTGAIGRRSWPLISVSSTTLRDAWNEWALRCWWSRPPPTRRPSWPWRPTAFSFPTVPGIRNRSFMASKPSKTLLGRLPIFGICLGNQILGLALGGRTYKLKFGHRGCQPAGQESDYRQGGDHLSEPWVRRGHGTV
jgi:carbamoyl-phosphate synthase small subunit